MLIMRLMYKSEFRAIGDVAEICMLPTVAHETVSTKDRDTVEKATASRSVTLALILGEAIVPRRP